MPSLLAKICFVLSLLLCANNTWAAQCEHVFTNHWGSGFQAEIRITNTGTTPITDWTVTWSYSDSTNVNNVWNGISSGTNPVTATPPPDSFDSIAPGATWTMGLTANGAGAGVSVSGDVCDTDSPNPVTFQLAKTWANGIAGDAITATTSGLATNATVSSTSTGSNTETGVGVSVSVGDVFTLSAETFTSGSATDYTASDWVCDDNANSVIAAGSSYTVSPADAGNTVTCTIENAYVDPTGSGSSELACVQVITNNWGSGFNGEIQITNTSNIAITNWSTTWSYSDGTSVSNVWNGIGSGSNPISATPPNYFSTLAPGATWSVGFTANGQGAIDTISCSTVLADTVELTLIKVVNNSVGSATANDWTLNATLAGNSVLNGTSGVTSSSLAAGEYQLSEYGGPSAYQLVSIVCDAGALDTATNTLTLSGGDVATCTFTNRDIVSDLAVSKSVNNTTPNVGDVLSFTLHVSNAGPDPASNVQIDDILPAGFAFVAGSMTGGDSQNQTAPNLAWIINNLGVGASNAVSLQYQATVQPP